MEMYSFDTHRRVPYLPMGWFPSPNLKKRIRAKEDWEKLAYLLPKIIEQAAEGLGCLHNFGWVDRDVKPDNFLVADDGQVKTLDFGLAIRAKHGLGRILAFRPKRQGTPSYMSPEQIRCAPLDERADVYSFGCVVYEMFAGNPPFTANSREELFTKHLKLPPPSLEAAAENVTPEFAQLVRSCMAKDPQSRPATAGDFLAEFRRVRVFKIQPRRPDRAGS
jgi:serine/threonine-protein kinase